MNPIIPRHPAVRDLDWALSSPSLVLSLPHAPHHAEVIPDAVWREWRAAYAERLAWLDANPTELEAFLARNTNHRLGYYFEYLLAFWLQDGIGHPFRLWRHHLPVRQGSLTLGEMDFLVEHAATGELEHWEVAVKFYLGAPPLGDIFRWVGPNRSDTLGRKLDHLATRQFRFDEAEGRRIDRRCAVVRGRLFHPAHGRELPSRFVSPDHLRGLWFTRDEFLDDPRTAGMRWRPAGREEWLTSRQDIAPEPLAAREDLPFVDFPDTQLVLGFEGDSDATDPWRCFLVRHRPH